MSPVTPHPPLSLVRLDWFGERMDPPAEFSFSFESELLVFRALRRRKRDLIRRYAGRFMESLWTYTWQSFLSAIQ